jgi:hypothetical protein
VIAAMPAVTQRVNEPLAATLGQTIAPFLYGVGILIQLNRY